MSITEAVFILIILALIIFSSVGIVKVSFRQGIGKKLPKKKACQLLIIRALVVFAVGYCLYSIIKWGVHSNEFIKTTAREYYQFVLVVVVLICEFSSLAISRWWIRKNAENPVTTIKFSKSAIIEILCSAILSFALYLLKPNVLT